ncbi:Uncharacterised protein [Actinobaculum suis]|uniref:Uncharacterized protein n=1 Tax=Actinobaculum suis TaxID=1657 RepID=A0A7Z9C8Y0_9ACTO|nr:Uncharacterised protein [Actinobaculum suis]
MKTLPTDYIAVTRCLVSGQCLKDGVAKSAETSGMWNLRSR